MPPKRMTANPVRPARHRAGKATGASSESESDPETSEIESERQKRPDHKIAPPPKVMSAGRIVSKLGQVDLNEQSRQGKEAEDRRLAAERSARLAAEEGFVTEESDERESEGESEEGSDDEEAESSEDEVPRRLMLKPKFIPKSQRNAKSKEAAAAGTEGEAVRIAEEEEARKKKAMDELVEEQMRKDAEARAVGKKHWDDLMDEEEDVDTEDDKDPEAEYAAWKLRELKRIKREREAIEAREKEREEVERRRNLTEEERKAEDEAFIAQQKEEKDAKGKMAYMQKYFHRGAFYQDDEAAESLAKRDIMGARFADDVKNRELLPQALQMRDMTKLGKKGASKYKDLKSEDTGRWGEFRDTRPGRDFDRGNFDDRYKSDRYQERSGPGGANAVPLGDRKGVTAHPSGPRNSATRREGDRHWDRDSERSHDRNSYMPRDESYDRRRHSRSRSRSPRRDDRHHDTSRRKRDSSRDPSRYESDKRRRIDSGRQ
ncbi:splicing factor, Prp19-binding domain-containing protein [Xylaria bambusicola]|uniref:splicing factor, Prp19-binding domain-containing protein n=1 Tax=Xylaria bambusicola TaxID=326684 RepID=UPI002007D967|nr:splicing factor, Prp19-binding domain-containing protein [Xylaria bambusicola]KAI0525703.1 splicing factor, Prp19-binding domain-containing protein [Xylaria bambusicola]